MKTINTVFLILFVSLVASPLFAQSDLSIGSLKTESEINTFVQKVEGAGDLAATVQAADGGYVTVSRIDRTSFLVMKIKASGQKKWERTLNFDTSNPFFVAFIDGIAQTTDGGFVLSGFSGLVKLGPDGIESWKKILTVNGLGPNFTSVAATPDGGVVATGVFPSDADKKVRSRFVGTRFTATGDVLWKKNYESLPHAGVFLIPPSVPTADNGLIVTIPTLKGVDVIKINNSGNVVWKKSLKTGPAFGFQSAGKTADGGVILIGTGPNLNKLKVVVLKGNGTFGWKAAYFLKVPGKIRSVSSPIETLDGGYVVMGSSLVHSRRYGFIAKIDSSRNIAFQNAFGSGRANGESVFATAHRGFILFGGNVVEGHRGRDSMLILKVDSEGIVPGCDFFQSFGGTTSIPFGPLKMGSMKITELNDLSLESVDFGLSSVVTNHRVSTTCN